MATRVDGKDVVVTAAKRGRGRPKKGEVFRPTPEAILAERALRASCPFFTSFRDDGPTRRELYPKHMAFMAAGKHWAQRAFLAGNRTGKTFLAAYELTCHLTGTYPPWWKGRRFDAPIEAWIAGDTAGTVRDILQTSLLGPTSTVDSREWSGMIPRPMVHDVARKPGVPMAVSTIWVHHASGGMSSCDLKCHPAGSRVLMADGSWERIERIQLGMSIRTADGVARSVTQLHAYTDAVVKEVATRGGSIRATGNHPIHTSRGWVNVDDIVLGDVVTEAWCEPEVEVPQEPWRVCLTALMIGDGCTRGKTPTFTCNEAEIVERVIDVCPPDMEVAHVVGSITYKIASWLHNENRLKDSLVADGIWGEKSTRKFIPPWVFRLPREQRVMFLHWLWGCDGTVDTRTASYSTASPRLAEDVRLLLLSVGIRVPVCYHRVGNQSGKRFDAWYLALYGKNRIAFDEIGKMNRWVPSQVTPRPKGPTGEVIAINEVGRHPVYCVGVDDVHELIVDGFRVGNSFDQKREAFQGTAKHLVWLDEECPEDIYGECLMRTMTTSGLMVVTFTPLQGLTPFIASWLERSVVEVLDERGRSQLRPAKGEVFKGVQSSDVPDVEDVAKAAGDVSAGERNTRYIVMATWDDAPHLTREAKDAMLLEFPVHQRDARSRGIPALGSGVIYPIPEGDITVAPFAIPEHWPRCFGMDIDAGAGWTAAAWLAKDPDANVFYLYDVYKRSHAEPVVHAEAIKARGKWIPGVADAAALLVTAGDSQQVIAIYRKLGLDVVLPDKSVEAGIFDVWTLLSGGRLKVFASCGAFFEEFRLYRRDSKGRVVKQHDHVMDCVRYCARSGIARMKVKPGDKDGTASMVGTGSQSSWMM